MIESWGGHSYLVGNLVAAVLVSALLCNKVIFVGGWGLLSRGADALSGVAGSIGLRDAGALGFLYGTYVYYKAALCQM